ncbi:MAG: hypothetical protein HY053_04955 [Proteobacteria bacterium]|nr:hypothetical protein [Pseudomonadota bacterium]
MTTFHSAADQRLISLLKAPEIDRAAVLVALDNIDAKAEINWALDDATSSKRTRLPWLAAAALALSKGSGNGSGATTANGAANGSGNLIMVSLMERGASATDALRALIQAHADAGDNPALQEKIMGAARLMRGAVKFRHREVEHALVPPDRGMEPLRI